MATVLEILRTCSLLLYLIFQVSSTATEVANSTLQSLQVVNVTCDQNTCKYLLSMRGGEFLGHKPWRLTPEEGAKGGSCEVIYPNYELKEIDTSQWISKIEVSVPNIAAKIYFCLRETVKNTTFRGSWVHQGAEYFLEPRKDVVVSPDTEVSNTAGSKNNSTQKQETDVSIHIIQNLQDVSNKNETQEVNTKWTDLTHDIDVNYLPNVPRPTREERNDIEVLVNNKYVPLNTLLEQTEIESKNSIDSLDRRENNIDHVNDIVQDNKRELLALTNDVNYNVLETINSKEKIDYTKEIFDKIDLAISKLKREIIDADITKNEVNNLSGDIPFQDIKVNTGPSIVSHIRMPYQEIQEKENVNTVYIKINPKNIIDKLDELLNKIQSIKCAQQAFLDITKTIPEYTPSLDIDSPDLRSFGLHIPNMHFLSTTSPNVNSPALESLNVPSLNMHTPNIHSSDINISDMHSSDLNVSDMHSSDLNISNMHSPGVRSSDVNFSNIQSSKKNSSEFRQELLQNTRVRRETFPDEAPFTSVRAVMRPILIGGIRIEDSVKEPKIIENGIPSVLAESSVLLRVYGEGLTERTVIAFTHDPQPHGQPCKFLLKGEYMVKESSLQAKTALFQIYAPSAVTGSKLYICAKNLLPNRDPTSDEEKYLHQGMETWKMLGVHTQLLPLWFSIGLILFCLMFSALFSGLNLGLMSLDRTELKIISNTGTEQERKYARAIMPVRDHGNYLLCSILLGNVAVNSTFTILLDELTSGLFAVIFSTLAIVLLGEITPQAICSRHGLMVGAKSIMVTKGVMAVTAPLSFPVSKLLDYFLGEEIGNVYNRERLKELVKVTTDVNDLDKDEVNIISGALEMRKKTVKDVMTKLEDAFMLPISSVLDFETMSEIVKSGYSRIPVYEGGRGNIVTVLFIKDLAFVDPDDNTPLRTLCQYYQNAAHFVFEDLTLDVMFRQFKDGHKGHMAFVHRINNEGEGDPFYETIGLVTLEDVIEEMIQSEIVDETDVFLDNRSKRRRRPQNKLQDFAAFAERHENQRIHISPQLTLASFQFLSTSVDAFRPDTVSETVLRRLLKQDVIQLIKVKDKTKRDPTTYVFQQGKPVDYFVLILEGRVEVTVGRENLVFEAGPFTYFGVQALTQNIGVAESPTPSAMGSLQNINMDAMLRHTFVPDYSVRAIASLIYLTVKRSLYLAAKRATLMEKGNISKGGTTQEFDTEVDKLLQSVDEDLSITGEHKTPSRQVSPNPVPASPAPRALDARNGHAYAPTHRNSQSDEQERLLK